ncbi:DNA pilot protein [Sigmofec virus UA08Rod_5080]|uniref:DNA pilot protein n=1 Tax=Sigmofec virus UA08Rod_5080 TaxID=2929414 RepID=A0A976R8M0_9VIRU|nr:DNA pilot protein [Sigmofec virus UA08Rod_5080]
MHKFFEFPIASTLISSAGGLLESLFSAINQNKVLNAQKQENSLNRQFNAEQAEISRQFTEDMWNKQNAYNDPSQVVNRLVKAGLNPALAFGGFANADLASNSSTASSNGSVNPPALDTSGINSIGNSYLSAKQAEAQIRLTNAEAAEKEAALPYAAQKAKLETDALEMGIKLDLSKKNLNEQEINNMLAEYNEIKQRVVESKSRVNLNEQQIELLIKENTWFEASKDAELKEAMSRVQSNLSSAHLSDVEAWRLSQLVGYEIQEKIANASKTTNESNLLYIDYRKQKALIKKYGLDKLTKQQWDIVNESINNTMANTAYLKESKRLMSPRLQTETLLGISRLFLGGAMLLK